MRLRTLSLISLAMVFFLVCCDTPAGNGDVEDQATDVGMKINDPYDPEQHPWIDVYHDQVIFSPLTININSRGKWMAHEGELGHIELYDEWDSLLTKSIMRSKDGKWMTSGDAWFTAEIEFDAGGASKGKLFFHKRFVTTEGGNKEDKFELPVYFGASFGEPMCFVKKRPSPIQEGEFNYHFVHLRQNADGMVMGFMINAPYGTDGSRSSFLGSLDKNSGKISGTARTLAEGDLNEEEVAYYLKGSHLEFDYEDMDGTPYSIEKVSCERFEEQMKAFENSLLSHSLNSMDRTRVLGLKEYEGYDFSEKGIKEVRFVETEIDLDTKWETREFLLYLMDPMMCGTGGCTLFLINENSEILSRTTVVKMPVYMRTSRARGGAMTLSGWRDLFVWSDGAFRQLTNNGDNYSTNASMAPPMAEQNLEYYPEKYFKAMDHRE